MTDETPAVEATVAPADQAATPEQPVEAAAPVAETPAADAAANDEARKSVENEFHRLVSNGLHIFGKLEHWTAEEIAAFAEWLRTRL